MTIRKPVLCLVAIALIGAIFTPPLCAQRNLFNQIIGDVVDQAINQRNRDQRDRDNEPEIGNRSFDPNESGRNNNDNQFRPDNNWLQPRPNPRQPPRNSPPRRSTPRTESEPPELRIVGNNLPTKITLPKTQTGACSFALVMGSREYPRTLRPGQMQPLKGTNSIWKVRYNGNGGTRSYRLRGGVNYVFQRDDQNFWQLYSVPEDFEEEPPELPRYE